MIIETAIGRLRPGRKVYALKLNSISAAGPERGTSSYRMHTPICHKSRQISVSSASSALPLCKSAQTEEAELTAIATTLAGTLHALIQKLPSFARSFTVDEPALIISANLSGGLKRRVETLQRSTLFLGVVFLITPSRRALRTEDFRDVATIKQRAQAPFSASLHRKATSPNFFKQTNDLPSGQICSR